MAQLIVYLLFITYSNMILNRRYIGPNGMRITEGCVCVCVRERERERFSVTFFSFAFRYRHGLNGIH